MTLRIALTSGDPLAEHQFTAKTADGASAAPAAAAAAAAAPAAAALAAATDAAKPAGESVPAFLAPDSDAATPDPQTECQRLRSLLAAHFPRGRKKSSAAEYCQLAAAVKAAIAARLTSDILEVHLGLFAPGLRQPCCGHAEANSTPAAVCRRLLERLVITPKGVITHLMQVNSVLSGAVGAGGDRQARGGGAVRGGPRRRARRQPHAHH